MVSLNGQRPRYRRGDRVRLPTGQTGLVDRQKGQRVRVHWGTTERGPVYRWHDVSEFPPEVSG